MSFDDLAASLRGELVTPDSAHYDEVRAVYNAMIDKKPAALARCVDATDVQTCVNYARDNGVSLAIRGGGHNAGSSLNFPVKSPYGSPRSVKLLIPPTCLAGEARCEAPRLS